MRTKSVQSAPEMAPKTKQIVVRLEEELAARIDAYAERLRAETGLEVSHAAATRRVLIAGLDALEASEKPKRGRGA